jgi:hypothetical protein
MQHRNVTGGCNRVQHLRSQPAPVFRAGVKGHQAEEAKNDAKIIRPDYQGLVVGVDVWDM